ncbi:hypothetical protein, partial [Candidatus Hakubella thermalkaliphila]|uniref:hypothetical protein n=1 Tax=Candidatus Hakubella thermalkaliphila TaxID=2754717 RepID=UPI001C6126E3
MSGRLSRIIDCSKEGKHFLITLTVYFGRISKHLLTTLCTGRYMWCKRYMWFKKSLMVRLQPFGE